MTDELVRLLAGHGHGTDGVAAIQAFLGEKALTDRLDWLAENLLTPALAHADAQARVDAPVEPFRVLQGDLIRSSSAYKLGVRIDGDPTYVIATSSCDLVEGRRSTALLLPVVARTRVDFANDRALTAALETLTAYRPKKHFYLPVLPDDGPDVVCNVALMDPLHVIANDQINLAERRASLSLIGWRIFGALVRELLVREAEHEDRMRDVNAST